MCHISQRCENGRKKKRRQNEPKNIIVISMATVTTDWTFSKYFVIVLFSTRWAVFFPRANNCLFIGVEFVYVIMQANIYSWACVFWRHLSVKETRAIMFLRIERWMMMIMMTTTIMLNVTAEKSPFSEINVRPMPIIHHTVAFTF